MRKKHDKFLNPEGIAGISIPTRYNKESMDFPAMIWWAFYRIVTKRVLFNVKLITVITVRLGTIKLTHHFQLLSVSLKCSVLN